MPANTRSTVLERLNHALHTAMDSDERVYVLGEDLLDPYGGAFKVTRGLSSRFPGRVWTTPISEASIVGVASGMALRGLRPVAEIMFGDFLTLAADQLVNHAAKFRWMYNDLAQVPLVVRTPMGGRRGYGPTHSQSLEKLFMGVPGLKVLAPNTVGDPAVLLAAAIQDSDPVLFIEHKLLYSRPLLETGSAELRDFRVDTGGRNYQEFYLRPAYSTPPALTIACYGYNFELARQAAVDLLYEYEIFSDIVLYSQLSPFDTGLLRGSLKHTGRLLVVEEGGLTLGWGAEILARVVESGVNLTSVRRVAGLDLPVANSRPLEEAILPSPERILRAALQCVGIGEGVDSKKAFP